MIIYVLVTLSIIHLFLKIFGAKKKIIDTYSAGFYIYFVSVIVGSLFTFLPDLLMGSPIYEYAFVMLIATLIMYVWSLVVSVNLYSELHEMSQVKTFIALIIPIMIVFAVAMFFLFMLLMAFGGDIGGIFEDLLGLIF